MSEYIHRIREEHAAFDRGRYINGHLEGRGACSIHSSSKDIESTKWSGHPVTHEGVQAHWQERIYITDTAAKADTD